jgi:ribulose 1,5-bisphosphate synthetase/thiazole synthase
MKKEPDQNTESAWTADMHETDYPILDESLETDACIIGGGLCGILTAYLLNKSGKRVALIEKDRIGRGATGVTTAFLTASLDTDFPTS